MAPTPSTGNKKKPDSNEDGIYASAYRKLPEQPPGTIRFFDGAGDGENFVLFNNDAQLAAKDVFKTNVVIKSCKYDEDKRLEYVHMIRANFESFVRELLLIRQFRVEVFVNVSKSKGKIEWMSKYKGSPGNLTQFDDVLFSNNNEMTVNNGVMGVRIGNVEKTHTVGICFVNMNECEIHLIEFADNESLTNLETVLVQLSPKEAVFPVIASQKEEIETLKKILERNGVLINEQKTADFDTKDIDQDMTKLLQIKKGKTQSVALAAHPDFEKKLAISALAGTIKYLELLSGEMYQNQFTLKPFDIGLYAKMNGSACQALHLSLNNLEKKSRNDVSLLGVVDKCRTAQGHRLMSQYLKQPLLDKEKLEERLDVVQILVEDVILRQSIRDDHLRKVPDCQIIAKKLLKKKATLQDCHRAYMFLYKMDKMLEDLKGHESSRQHVLKARFIEPLVILYKDLSKFQELVEETLDLEMADKGEYIVKASFDDKLAELKEEMEEVETKMGNLLYKVAKELDLDPNKSVKLESNGQHGHFFRVTLKDELAIRDNKKFEILHSARGGAGFRNAKLESLSNEYIKCRSKYESEQKDIVTEVMVVTADYHTCFEQLGRIIAELDVFASFAFISANSPLPYVRPKLQIPGYGCTRFKGLRHPCIENISNVNFIPNDIEFEKDKQTFFIITGPNMGGKSTFLRSIGIAVLLAQVGCFVPATEAEVSIVDAILVRVGASDSLAKGVSTFMAEMIESAHILKTATSDSLVLIDELGRGTSTYDGFGLCWAISKHLAKEVNCNSVLATHFHELTALADEVPNVANYHVTAAATDYGLTMLYTLEKGPCDRSFGLHVAQYVGFPPLVLKDARDMSKMLEDFCQEEDKDDDQVAVKRRRDNKIAGQHLVSEFIEKVQQALKEQMAAIENKTVTDEEADVVFQSKVAQLLKEIEEKAGENSYLKHLLLQASSAKTTEITNSSSKLDTEMTEILMENDPQIST